jgi:hypothetical protein
LSLAGHHPRCLLGCDSVVRFIGLDKEGVVMLRVSHIGWWMALVSGNVLMWLMSNEGLLVRQESCGRIIRS